MTAASLWGAIRWAKNQETGLGIGTQLIVHCGPLGPNDAAFTDLAGF
jgi:hypothetical protein